MAAKRLRTSDLKDKQIFKKRHDNILRQRIFISIENITWSYKYCDNVPFFMYNCRLDSLFFLEEIYL